MPSISDLTEYVAETFSEPPARVRQIARRLLEAGELPQSSGRSIAQAEPVHAARLLTAVVAAKANVSAVKDMRHMLDLEDPTKSHHAWLDECFGGISRPASLELVLAAIIADRARDQRLASERKWPLAYVEFVPNCSEAFVALIPDADRGRRVRLRFFGREENEIANGFGRSDYAEIVRSVKIHGTVFLRAGSWLRESQEVER